MNVKYKIGDRVRLKKTSEYYPHQSNGKDGTIESFEYGTYLTRFPNGHDIHDTDDEYYFYIDWDGGGSNSYRIRDIEPAVITTTRIPIPDVDMYIAVTDPSFLGEAMYVQVTREFSMESDGNLRGYGNLITFEKSVKFDSRVSIYSEHHNRRFLPMSNREIVWMNYCLHVDNYISYDLWKPSADDLLKLEVLDRYPNLKVGERFGFVHDYNATVKSIHPRDWTVDSHSVYLARPGDGGAMVYKNGSWADRSGCIDPSKDDDEVFITSSWCIACNPNGEDQYELREWRGSSWQKPGYLDNTRWWTVDKPANKHLISYQTFLEKVYYPSKGMTPPPPVVIKESVVTSSTTHLPYLNIGTKEKRTSFIEDVQPIKIKTSKQRVSNKLKIN